MKKIVLVVLFFAVFAFANQNPMMDPNFFTTFKKQSIAMVDVSKPYMESILECAKKSNTKSQMKNCISKIDSSKFKEKIKELTKNLPMNGMENLEEDDMAEYENDDFVWNKDTKNVMIKDLEESLKHSENSKKCWKNSINMMQLGKCMSKIN